MRVFLTSVVLVAVVLALSAGELRAQTVLANVAAFQPACGTDPGWGYPPPMGNDDSRFFTFSHGDASPDSWWCVDLGQAYTVDHVDIYCRYDYSGIYPDRTNGATLQAYAGNCCDELGDPVGDPVVLSGFSADPLVNKVTFTGPWTGVRSFKIGGTGLAPPYLHIAEFDARAEVETYATFLSEVTATATESYTGLGVEPMSLVNNRGMKDQHAGIGTPAAKHYAVYGDATWHSVSNPATDPVITFDLGGTYEMAQMSVWNSHQSSTRGVRECLIEVSTDGEEWTELPNTNGDDLGNYTLHPIDDSGGPYPATDHIDLTGVTASHVRLTALSTYGDTYRGLSEVRFYQVPEPSMLALLALGGLILLGRRMK